MHKMLKYLEREIKKVKSDTDNNVQTYDIVLIFDRSEEQMKRLTGYEDFARELEELGGGHDEETIQEACKRSHFHRDSVYFGESETEEFPLTLRCTRSQYMKFAQKHKSNYTD